MNPSDIERIAAAALGAPAPQPGPAADPAAMAAAAAGAQPAAPAAAPAQARTSAEDQAQTTGAPQTEADKMAAAAVVFELPGKDGKPGRKFTATQIEGMADRYAQLNYEHAQLKPVVDLAKEMLKRNPGMTASDLTDAIISLAKAGEHNPTMGHQGRAQTAAAQGLTIPDDDALTKWEQENAAALPPGYRELMGNMSSTQRMIGEQTALLQRLLAQAGGVADGARDAMAQSQQTMIDARKQQIGSNLDRAQMALQLPDAAANDFMIWAGERGYTLEDFIDPQMTFKVMKDFRNDLMSGEVSRLQGIQQRRQAFTGSAGQLPAGGTPGATGQDPAKADFEAFANRIMAKRSA